MRDPDDYPHSSSEVVRSGSFASGIMNSSDSNSARPRKKKKNYQSDENTK